MPIVYLTVAQVLEARARALEISESADTGAVDLGTIESILEHIQNDGYYESFEEKLTHLFFSLTQFHCFTDGNKRTALAATLYMMLLNDHQECARTFLHEVENIVVHVAAGRIDKPLLLRIITAKIAGTFDDNEGLKLQILEAISVDEEG